MMSSLHPTSGATTSNNASNWSHIRRGEAVKVFMGAGWQKGTLVDKLRDSVTVKLKDRTVRCFDPRNVRTA